MEPRWKKKFATAVIFYCGTAIGVTDNFFGPSLIEFKNLLGTDIETINVVSTACQFFLLASIFGFSLLFNHVRRECIAPFLLTLLAVSVGALPYSINLLMFGGLISTIAIARGGVIASTIVWIIDIWGSEAGPYLQGQHAFHALGIIFPPLVFAPFLSNGFNKTELIPLDPIVNITGIKEIAKNILFPGTSTSTTTPTSSLLIEATTLYPYNSFYETENSTLYPSPPTPPNLRIPSAICGGMILLAALLQAILYFVLRSGSKGDDVLRDLTICDLRDATSSSSSSSTSVINKSATSLESALGTDSDLNEVGYNPQSHHVIISPRSKYYKLILIIISIFIYGSFLSAELINVDFMTIFLHYSPLRISTEDGAHILIMSAAAYIAATFAGILLNLRIPSKFIVAGNICILLGGFSLLWVATSLLSEDLVRLAAILIAVGLSTGIPSIFHYIELHLHITNLIGAILVVSSGLIVLGYRFILGGFIEFYPFVYLYVNVGIVSCTIFGLISMWWLTK